MGPVQWSDNEWYPNTRYKNTSYRYIARNCTPEQPEPLSPVQGPIWFLITFSTLSLSFSVSFFCSISLLYCTSNHLPFTACLPLATLIRMWDGICRTDIPCKRAARSWASISYSASPGSFAPMVSGRHACPAACPPPSSPTTPRTVLPPSGSRSSTARTRSSPPEWWQFLPTALFWWTACIRGSGARRSGAGPAGICSTRRVGVS